MPKSVKILHQKSTCQNFFLECEKKSQNILSEKNPSIFHRKEFFVKNISAQRQKEIVSWQTVLSFVFHGTDLCLSEGVQTTLEKNPWQCLLFMYNWWGRKMLGTEINGNRREEIFCVLVQLALGELRLWKYSGARTIRNHFASLFPPRMQFSLWTQKIRKTSLEFQGRTTSFG